MLHHVRMHPARFEIGVLTHLQQMGIPNLAVQIGTHLLWVQPPYIG